jgi:hypothetical protein
MSDVSTSDLHSNVTHAGTTNPAPSYDIAPEDQHHLTAIRAMSANDAPPPYDIPEGIKFSTLTVAALPKQRAAGVMASLPTQAEVLAQLVGVPAAQRPATETALVANAIRAMRPALRVAGGVGKNATPFQREQVAIAREVQDGNREIERLQERIDEIERHATVVDESTGEVKAVPVYRLEGRSLMAAQQAQRDIMGRIRALVKADGSPGFEGFRRLKEAEYESVMARKEIAQQLADDAEAKLRTEAELREDRIAQRVKSMKRMRTSA